MRIFHVGLRFCILIFLSASVLAGPTESLSTLLKAMHSMQADFTQTVIDKNGKTVQQAKGHMQLQRPNQFRWQVTQPNPQIIVTNGRKLWIYDPDLEQVTIRSLTQTAGETPAMLLSDENLSLTKEFNVRLLPSAGASLVWFYLVPKDKSSLIASLKLGFVNQTIQEMHLMDHLGHTTVILFKNSHYNEALSADLFTFKIPPHVDVIDETQR